MQPLKRKITNMTNTITAQLDAEIAKAKKQAAERIAKLKREAAAEQKKIDAKVIDLLRGRQPELYQGLVQEAMKALAEGRIRSTRAGRSAATASSSQPRPTGHGVANGGFGPGE